LPDGREIAVQHPEFVAPSPTGRTAIVFCEDEACKAIGVLHIARIEDSTDAARNARRGSITDGMNSDLTLQRFGVSLW
jgi:hypothetical protein